MIKLMKLRHALGLWLIASCACSGGSGNTTDAPVSPVDGLPDAVAPCPAANLLTGEYIDWDSSDAAFKGIFDGSFTVDGAPSKTDKTSPNGRFELCSQVTTTAKLLIDGPGVGPTGYVDGAVIIERAVLDGGGFYSMRSFTQARAIEFYQTQIIENGFDATRAHLLVHVVGTPRPLVLDTVAASTALTAGAWSRSTTGSEVLFANLDPALGTATVTVAGVGSVVGAGLAPLAAGKFTYLTLVLK
jgi:hypothetical protein